MMSVRVQTPFFLSLGGCKPELNKLFSGNLRRALDYSFCEAAPPESGTKNKDEDLETS